MSYCERFLSPFASCIHRSIKLLVSEGHS